MNQIYLLAIVFTCTISLGSITALAQSVPEEEVVVLGARLETSLADQAPDVDVLSSAELAMVAPVHIQQSLSQVPGVSLHRGEGQESLPAIRSAVQTGAGACGSVLVLEEGIPVRGAGLCNVNELFDTHFEQAQRIELLRGAGSAFYGSNALNGIVNVILPTAGVNQLSLELGPNQYRRAKAAMDTSLGQLFISSARDGGYRDESGYTQHKLSWRKSWDTRQWNWSAGLTATDLDQETAGFIGGENAYLDERLARQNPNPEAFRDTRSLRAWLSINRELANAKSLRASLYLRDTDMDFLLHFLPGDPLEQNSQSGVGWQSAIDLPLKENLVLSAGVDGEFAWGDLKQVQDQPTQGSAFLQETIPVGVQYDYQVDSRQLALFSHLDWQVNARLGVQAGLRWERIEYDYDNLGLSGRTRDDGTECGFGGCRYSRPADATNGFSHVSPKLELSYAIGNELKLWAAVADAFRAPQASELYRLQRAQTIASLDTVNARSAEIGLRYEAKGRQATVSVFDTKTKNVIIRDADFFNVNGQSIRSQGIELGIKQSLSDALSFQLAASYASHRYASDQVLNETSIRGNLVDTAPRVFGNAQLNLALSDKAWAQWEVVHMGRYFLEPNNRFEYPGHTLHHLRGTYQYNEQWQSSLRLINAADKRYAERADYTSFTEQRYFPGLPRSIYAELRYSF